jgi:hypothetical protein
MITFEAVPGIRGRRMIEISGGGEFNYDIFGTLKELLKYSSVPAPSTT